METSEDKAIFLKVEKFLKTRFTNKKMNSLKSKVLLYRLTKPTLEIVLSTLKETRYPADLRK